MSSLNIQTISPRLPTSVRKIPALHNNLLVPQIGIAHNSHMQMNTNQIDQAKPAPKLTAALTRDLLDGSVSALDLCDYHNLKLNDLIAIINSDDFKYLKSSIEEIDTARQSILESQARTAALSTLTKLTTRPIESQHDAETTRKAATKLEHITRPRKADKNFTNSTSKTIQDPTYNIPNPHLPLNPNNTNPIRERLNPSIMRPPTPLLKPRRVIPTRPLHEVPIDSEHLSADSQRINPMPLDRPRPQSRPSDLPRNPQEHNMREPLDQPLTPPTQRTRQHPLIHARDRIMNCIQPILHRHLLRERHRRLLPIKRIRIQMPNPKLP
tara:strand:- start:902 stop:1876 length:975 start_codon:yes stop_codon:yes gene_type:complete